MGGKCMSGNDCCKLYNASIGGKFQRILSRGLRSSQN